jgi:putative transposase
VIRLTVMMYIRYSLSLRQVEDMLFERDIGICHETVRFWWNRFGPLFAAKIRKRRDLLDYEVEELEHQEQLWETI